MNFSTSAGSFLKRVRVLSLVESASIPFQHGSRLASLHLSTSSPLHSHPHPLFPPSPGRERGKKGLAEIWDLNLVPDNTTSSASVHSTPEETRRGSKGQKRRLRRNDTTEWLIWGFPKREGEFCQCFAAVLVHMPNSAPMKSLSSGRMLSPYLRAQAFQTQSTSNPLSVSPSLSLVQGSDSTIS